MSDTSIRKELVNLKANPEALKQMSYEDWWLNNCDERLFTPKEVESLLYSAKREARWDGAIEATEMYLQELKDKRAVALVKEPEGVKNE